MNNGLANDPEDDEEDVVIINSIPNH